MGKSLYFRQVLCIMLSGSLILGVLCSCEVSGAASSAPKERYIDPVVNEDGKLEFNTSDATVTLDSWTPTEEPPETADNPDAEEIVLTPSKTSDSTFEYLDAQGNVVATWEEISKPKNPAPPLRPGVPSDYSMFFELDPDERYTCWETFNADDGIIKLWMSIRLEPAVNSYIGFLDNNAQQYTWLEPPNSGEYNIVLTINNEGPIHVAIKNNTPDLLFYIGCYNSAPLLGYI